METDEAEGASEGDRGVHARFAARLCLVSSIPPDLLLESRGHFPIPGEDEGPRTRLVEERAGLQRSRYYYAGRAHPRFGESAFAFRPEIEADHTGSANPFDTGGAFYGKCCPFDALESAEAERRAAELIRSTLEPLGAWRPILAHFLSVFFLKPEDYFTTAPRAGARWSAPDLPAHFERNGVDPRSGWRAWTWEVRFHEPHDVRRGLAAWAGTDAAVTALINDSSSSATPGAPGAELHLGRPVAVGPDFCFHLEAWIREDALS